MLITEHNCLSMESSVKKIQASEERERRDGSANEPGDLLHSIVKPDTGLLTRNNIALIGSLNLIPVDTLLPGCN